jgi:hypothetical protein
MSDGCRQSVLESHKEPPKVLAVLVYAVIFGLDVLLFQKADHGLLQLSAALARNDLHERNAVLYRLVYHAVQFGIYLLAFVEYLVQVEDEFCHEAKVAFSH